MSALGMNEKGKGTKGITPHNLCAVVCGCVCFNCATQIANISHFINSYSLESAAITQILANVFLFYFLTCKEETEFPCLFLKLPRKWVNSLMNQIKLSSSLMQIYSKESNSKTHYLNNSIKTQSYYKFH